MTVAQPHPITRGRTTGTVDKERKSLFSRSSSKNARKQAPMKARARHPTEPAALASTTVIARARLERAALPTALLTEPLMTRRLSSASSSAPRAAPATRSPPIRTRHCTPRCSTRCRPT
eukprot:scaffold3762_cov118-Isochrysis_galbana.AAC.10